ncbi:UNVERIFIED_CONTAM: Retrovirus-related Pol polyprotein from transposon TNT 1-94 [Sesamum calycinum]|uniref:Retrovirus-related Pol polyprotein from transposon TNT 1-94 n=1 Tax=Sesamum calycinum TaxID=2727403 RepID=A0AAW2L887_9LAMI
MWSHKSWYIWSRGKLHLKSKDCLNKQLPTALSEEFLPEECVTFEKWLENNNKICSIILSSMTNDIKKKYDRLDDVPSIMLHMEEVYVVPDRHIRYAATKAFSVIQMLSLVEKLEDLKVGLGNNMLQKSINKLINMLVENEATTHKSAPAVLVRDVSTSKAKGKKTGRWKRKKREGKAIAATGRATGAATALVRMGKGKGMVSGSQRSRANDVCMHCQGKEHWKRECPQLLSNPSVPVLYRSTRKSGPPNRYGFLGLTTQLDNDLPTYGAVISEINSDKWNEAMRSKIDSMGSNQVWILVDLPKGVKPVGCKWAYKRKLGANGEVTAFKARLIEEEIYMNQPEGSLSLEKNKRSAVSKGPSIASNKLPEAGTHILIKLFGVMISSRTNDILLISNNVKMLGDIKAWLSTQFSMKDMGEASYILDIKI